MNSRRFSLCPRAAPPRMQTEGKHTILNQSIIKTRTINRTCAFSFPEQRIRSHFSDFQRRSGAYARTQRPHKTNRSERERIYTHSMNSTESNQSCAHLSGAHTRTRPASSAFRFSFHALDLNSWSAFNHIRAISSWHEFIMCVLVAQRPTAPI